MLISVVFCIISFSSIHANVSVRTKQRTIIGFEDKVNNYIAFHGIPFASVITRYKEAKPTTNTSEFIANNSIICAHPTPSGIVGEEDCLTLNVFTKSVDGKKPVFVWLNGEEYSRPIDKPFTFKSLVENDIVVVTLNHRLSIFGFLCIGIEEAPGNAGIKDVIQGLEWVRDNIQYFGGDPSNVILIGHGSGAAIVDFITVSPKTENLVSKSVALSGSGLAPWAVAYDPVGYAKAFGNAMNFTNGSLKELANYLANRSIEDLGKAINNFEFTNNSNLFAPCIENNSLSGSFLVHAPLNLFQSRNHSQKPHIAGYVAYEGTMRAREATEKKWLDKMQTNFADFIPVDLEFNNNETAKNETAKEIREYYFGNKEVNNDSILTYLKYQGETLVYVPVTNAVRYRAAEAYESKVYLLNFAYEDGAGKEWPYNLIDGTTHGRLLDYILDGNDLAEIQKTILINRLVAFAHRGIPKALKGVGDVTWSPLNAEDGLTYFRLGGARRVNTVAQENVQVLNDTYEATLDFWSNFPTSPPKAVWSSLVEDSDTSYVALTESAGLNGLHITLIVLSIILLAGIAFAIWKNKTKLYSRVQNIRKK